MADSAWIDKQYTLTYPGITSIEVKRLVVVDQWALVAVIITQHLQTENTSVNEQIYTFRTLRNLGTEGWKLTSPVSVTWGSQHSVDLNCIHLTYYSFDAPYVQEVFQQIDSTSRQIAADFNIPLCGDMALNLYIIPVGSPPHTLPFWGQTTGNKLPSPLSEGFSVGLAKTPGQFLLGSITDLIGHTLLRRAYGERTKETSRIQLSHPIIQWEVEEATEHSTRKRLLEQFSKVQEQQPLSKLLDPMLEITPGEQPSMRELFSYFLVDTYGRTAIAFGKPLQEVEQQWTKWLSR